MPVSFVEACRARMLAHFRSSFIYTSKLLCHIRHPKDSLSLSVSIVDVVLVGAGSGNQRYVVSRSARGFDEQSPRVDEMGDNGRSTIDEMFGLLQLVLRYRGTIDRLWTQIFPGIFPPLNQRKILVACAVAFMAFVVVLFPNAVPDVGRVFPASSGSVNVAGGATSCSVWMSSGVE